MYNFNNRDKMLGKLSGNSGILLLLSSLIILLIGVFGLIEHKSPENLGSMSTLGLSFLIYIEYHLMIILGAFGSVFATWYLQNY